MVKHDKTYYHMYKLQLCNGGFIFVEYRTLEDEGYKIYLN